MTRLESIRAIGNLPGRIFSQLLQVGQSINTRLIRESYGFRLLIEHRATSLIHKGRESQSP